MSVDWDFIEAREGKAVSKAYVPDPKNSKSGVTVGSGVDLGQQSVASLAALKLSSQLVAKLKPYLGLKQEAAVAALKKTPLVLTKPEIHELDQAIRDTHLAALQQVYNAASRVKFADLPDCAQTILCSVSYQYGVGLSKRTPNFWGIVIRQDWEAAVKALRNFNDRYPTRRNLEADYLSSILAIPKPKVSLQIVNDPVQLPIVSAKEESWLNKLLRIGTKLRSS
jgi:hypothetical protein